MLYPDIEDVLALQLRSTECCTGNVPDPESVAVAGEFVALLTNETDPVADPVVSGANESVTLAVLPAAMVIGIAVPVMLNPDPVKFALETETDPVPVFESVTALLTELPSTTLPKATLVGDTLSR